jgi:hypothetical protein
MNLAAEEEREPRDVVLGLTAVQRVVAVGLLAVVGGVVGFLVPQLIGRWAMRDPPRSGPPSASGLGASTRPRAGS